MTLTLLLDLDDTLLDSNVDTFIPAYFKALSGYLADQVKPDKMLPALMAGTRKMMANQNPVLTLQQVFDAEFFPAIGIQREALQPRIDQFYDEVFPTLSHLTSPRPQAVEFVEWALEQGFRLAVSTNPLFPLKAIHHRMRWAGLPPESYPFEVVSSYETFHFAKPNLAYFAEVLGLMGWPETPVLMVGDDMERDIFPARNLGLPTYWVADQNPFAMEGLGIIGSIAELRPWLASTDLSTLMPAYSNPDSIMAILQSTPAVLTGLLAPFPVSAHARRPNSGAWSLVEILCHLRDTELEVNQERIDLILVQDEPFIPARNTDLWADERKYNNQDSVQALADFTAARQQTLEILKNLPVSDWQRKARHAIFGPTYLQELVDFIVEHDRLHIRQFINTLEKSPQPAGASDS